MGDFLLPDIVSALPLQTSAWRLFCSCPRYGDDGIIETEAVPDKHRIIPLNAIGEPVLSAPLKMRRDRVP